MKIPFLIKKGLLAGVGIASVGLAIAASIGILKFRHYSRDSAVQSRLAGIRAAADQYFLENGTFFVTYDDVVGPTRYLRSLSPLEGEDYRSLFPLRPDQTESLRVTLPRGQVVMLAGPRDVPDGVKVDEFDGRRFETTYRGGWPDGRSRVLDGTGRVVFEANYVQGHIVGPCWVFTGTAMIDLNEPTHRPPRISRNGP